MKSVSCFRTLFSGLVLVSLLLACGERPSADACCSFRDIPPASVLPDGAGLLRVEGSTDNQFSVLDAQGKTVATRRLNEQLALTPGAYTVVVNASAHTIEITEGKEARCATGTLMISGNTEDVYAVADSSGRALVRQRLGQAISLFPGLYRVTVNNTQAMTPVPRRALAELRTGTLLVRGNTDENYYVLDSAHRQLTYQVLGESRAFLPGRYEVRVNNTSRPADIRAGHLTEYPTGNLIVKGLTEEYFYVHDTLDRPLNYQSLNRPLAFFGGTFVVKVNNTATQTRIAPDSTVVFETGSLVLTGSGSEYYYVLDTAGHPLNFTSFNRALSLFPSEYTVKLGNTFRKVTVQPGVRTSLEAFH